MREGHCGLEPELLCGTAVRAESFLPPAQRKSQATTMVRFGGDGGVNGGRSRADRRRDAEDLQSSSKMCNTETAAYVL